MKQIHSSQANSSKRQNNFNNWIIISSHFLSDSRMHSPDTHEDYQTKLKSIHRIHTVVSII
jgi:hypothetical protein